MERWRIVLLASLGITTGLVLAFWVLFLLVLFWDKIAHQLGS